MGGGGNVPALRTRCACSRRGVVYKQPITASVVAGLGREALLKRTSYP